MSASRGVGGCRCKECLPVIEGLRAHIDPSRTVYARDSIDKAMGNTSPPIEGEKPTNPKDALGVLRVPLHLVSPLVKAYQSLAHYLGNVKYGAWNYRTCGARASVYIAALQRHVDKWTEGEEFDPIDGTPHLANAQACLNILIECSLGGNLVDDRPPSRAKELNETYAMVERVMGEIRERYKDRDPRHYTIADSNQRTP